MMANNESKELQKLLARQRELKAALERSEADALKLQGNLAASEFEGVLDDLAAFADLFSKGGAVFKLHREITEKLETLKDYDANYAQQLGRVDPYGRKSLDATLKYCVTQLLGGVWNTEAPLHKVLERMVETKNTPGNPIGGE